MGSRSRTVGPNAKIWVSNEFLGCPESPHQVSAKSVTGRKHPPWLSQKTTLKNQAELAGSSGIYRSSAIYGVRRTTFHPLAKCTAMRLSRYIINRRSEVWMIKTVFFIAKASFRNYLLRIELYDYLS